MIYCPQPLPTTSADNRAHVNSPQASLPHLLVQNSLRVHYALNVFLTAFSTYGPKGFAPTPGLPAFSSPCLPAHWAHVV
eukprot:1160549-Pelagomonas_calceolata.AAC.1